MDYDLAKKFIQQKKYNKALSLLLNSIEKESKSIKLYFLIGFIYFKLNQIENSIIYYEQALKIDPKSIEIILNLANSYYVIGNFFLAEKIYHSAIDLKNDDPRGYYGLYLVNSNNLNHQHINKLKEIKKKNISPNEDHLIDFLLSKNSKKKKNYELELKYLENFQTKCFNSRNEFNIQGLFYYNEVISKHYNKISFINSKFKNKEFTDVNPIFIIGLPRSGSTLIESCIFASDSNVISLGETSIFNTGIIDQIKNSIYEKNFQPENFDFKLDIDELRANVLNVYTNYFPTHKKKFFFIDKSLENFFNIEAILKIFPKAKFIHSKRNLKDCAIAIYQSMLPELPWAHSIPEILSYFDHYIKIISFYEKKFPNKILTIDLKELTQDQEFYTKKIFSFCGLKWSSDILEFYKKKNLIVKTLSNAQLRSKITSYNQSKYQSYENLLYDFKGKYYWLEE